jgi:hypothetical protein
MVLSVWPHVCVRVCVCVCVCVCVWRLQLGLGGLIFDSTVIGFISSAFFWKQVCTTHPPTHPPTDTHMGRWQRSAKHCCHRRALMTDVCVCVCVCVCSVQPVVEICVRPPAA